MYWCYKQWAIATHYLWWKTLPPCIRTSDLLFAVADQFWNAGATSVENSSHSVWSRKFAICPQRATHRDLHNKQTWRMPLCGKWLQGQHHCGGEPEAAGQNTWGKPHSSNWLYLSGLPFHVGQTNLIPKTSGKCCFEMVGMGMELQTPQAYTQAALIFTLHLHSQ